MKGIVWIGALAAVVLLILPAARSSLQPSDFASFLEKIQRRLDPAGWLCLLILLGTGMFQMSANPGYQGLLAINNRWAIAILVKHIVFIGMVAVSAYLTWGLLPALRRNALLRAKEGSSEDRDRLTQHEIWLLRVNFILGVIILGLTALARIFILILSAME
jgi:putative copper export protein